MSSAGAAGPGSTARRFPGSRATSRPPRRARPSTADEDAAFYWVHDEPLLRYLGAEARPALPSRRSTPGSGPRGAGAVEKDPEAGKRAASASCWPRAFPQTRTITHVIWAMFGVLPAGAVQLPHHHESVALDFIIDCKPGCYTMVGPVGRSR